MSAQDDDAANGQGKPLVDEVDPSLGQDPHLGEQKSNASSAGSEQDQPPLEMTDTASTQEQTGDATPPNARKRKSKTKENLSKKHKEKRQNT